MVNWIELTGNEAELALEGHWPKEMQRSKIFYIQLSEGNFLLSPVRGLFGLKKKIQSITGVYLDGRSEGWFVPKGSIEEVITLTERKVDGRSGKLKEGIRRAVQPLTQITQPQIRQPQIKQPQMIEFSLEEELTKLDKILNKLNEIENKILQMDEKLAYIEDITSESISESSSESENYNQKKPSSISPILPGIGTSRSEYLTLF